MSQLATVLTGASSGIGLELAHLFAKEAQTLVLVARRRERLDALAEQLTAKYQTDIRVISADLGAPNAAAHLKAQLNAEGLQVHTLINNAGFGMNGTFANTDPAVLSQMIQLNVLALTELTRLCVPDMIAQQAGRILNVASIVAFQPCPRFAVYAASKAFVLSFSEALSTELAPHGISVTALCPGSTETEFHQVAHNQKAALQRLPKDSAKDVAQAGYAALNRGERSIVTGWVNKPIPFLNRLTPKSVLLWAANKMAADA